MTSRHPSRVVIALLARGLPDDEPLAGDLIEAAHGRSRAWFWRQVLLAIALRTLVPLRARPRAAAEAVLVSTAMLALLGFHAVVVATLMNHLLVLYDTAWIPVTGRYQEWQLVSTLPAFAAAVVMGRALGRVHDRHRIAAILACGVSAALAAFLNLYLFVPDVVIRPFVPYAALQTAVAMVFIGGLFVGLSSRSRCEPLASS